MKTNLKREEQGFASIVIGLMIVVVLALITVGFAQLARREQQNALDSQLSTQAYYAAESGINDATSDIRNGYIDKAFTIAHNTDTTCVKGSDFGGAVPALVKNPNVSNANNVSYSCLLVKLDLQDLSYTGVEPQVGHTAIFNTDGQQLKTISVQWQSTTPGKTARPAGQPMNFKDATQWTYPAVIEIGITPLGALDRNSLIDRTYTTFMYPSGNGATVNNYGTGAGNQGKIVSGACTAAGVCKATITFASPLADTQYLIHFLNMYDKSDITITGTTATGTVASFIGAQAEIDSTGKAQDVLKRLKVRVPLNTAQGVDFAIQAQNVCKRMRSAPVAATNPNGTTFYADSGAVAAAGDPCFLTN